MDRDRFVAAIEDLQAAELSPGEAEQLLPQILGVLRDLALDIPLPLRRTRLRDGSPVTDEDVPEYPTHQSTLQEIRDYVDYGKWQKDGVYCPVCGRRNAVDSHALTRTFVQRIIGLYYLGPGWHTCEAIWTRAGQPHGGSYGTWSIGSYWGLIEPRPNEDDPTKKTKAEWRITQRGIDYVHGRLMIPHYADVYQSRCLQLHGDMESIADACGRQFDYRELLEGPGTRDHVMTPEQFSLQLANNDPWTGQEVPEPIIIYGDSPSFYQTYIHSPAWYRLRAQVLARNNDICENCNTRRAVHAHHLTYIRLGEERMEDLMAVCLPCHQGFHPGRRFGSDAPTCPHGV